MARFQICFAGSACRVSGPVVCEGERVKVTSGFDLCEMQAPSPDTGGLWEEWGWGRGRGRQQFCLVRHPDGKPGKPWIPLWSLGEKHRLEI